MGAKKDKDLKILDYKAKKNKEIAKNMKKFNIDDTKVAVIEAKQAHYEAWHTEVLNGPDY